VASCQITLALIRGPLVLVGWRSFAGCSFWSIDDHDPIEGDLARDKVRN
jgi:hypothetical protein